MPLTEYEQLRLTGEHWRISVLGEHLLRYEWSPRGVFEDRPTQVVTARPWAPVRAQVRRASGEAIEDELAAGEIRVDVAAHRAFVASRELQLTTREFELLRVLVRGGGQVVSIDDVLKEVWGEDPTGTEQTLEMHVTWLRRKLGDDTDAPRLLLRDGVGYRLVV